ncbi:MAG TPA: prepilin-type N-terminal cleavage/methylation domain-containing protein [Chthoniobacterales bacterium]|nr:prepilin-type N-terminal cleavage/methylation domain-containing protein [Chthoniobacterales bacterium]
MTKSRRRNGKRAFTLMEVVMALAVIGTMGAGAYVGFNSLNTYAISSRLYTEAQTAAQNQIDLILSSEPFDPVHSKIPTVLTLGTTTTPNIFVYTDPVSGNVVVTGTMTTTVTDLGTSMTFAGSTTNLNTYRATVAVSYTYRNTNYSVKMDTMRTGDQ